MLLALGGLGLLDELADLTDASDTGRALPAYQGHAYAFDEPRLDEAIVKLTLLSLSATCRIAE